MPYHHHDENLHLIKEKIKEIKIAIFKSEINSELQLPNNIIQALKVEDDGTVWFFTSCSGDHKNTIDRSFYAYLDFYRKGIEGRLQVSGHATIVNEDEEELLSISNYSKSIADRLVLVKMKMMQAEYTDTRLVPEIPWIERMKIAFNHFFFEHTNRKIYDFT